MKRIYLVKNPVTGFVYDVCTSERFAISSRDYLNESRKLNGYTPCLLIEKTYTNVYAKRF